MAATKDEIAKAFEVIAGLEYRKTWDLSGPCIVLREEWLDEAGDVVQEGTHNYSEDTAPPVVEEEPAAETQPAAADVGTIVSTNEGAAQ